MTDLLVKLRQCGQVVIGLMLLAGLPGMLAVAQEQPSWRMVLQLGEGIYVKTGIGTLPPNALDLDSAYRAISGVGYLARKLPEGGSIRRILKLADGRAIVYEVVVKQFERGKNFKVTLQPVTPTAQEAAQWGIDPQHIETEFLKSYSSPLTINDGDILALDVMVEPRSGVKLVDYFLLSNGPPAKRDDPENLAGKVRQFTVEEVELSIEGYELRCNGESIHRSDESKARGRFIWIEIPKVGRAAFTLTPHGDDGFLPVAIVNEDRIVFTLGADRYEWISRRRIAPGSGVYRLWMRHDQISSSPLNAADPSSGWASDWRIGSAPDMIQGTKKQ